MLFMGDLKILQAEGTLPQCRKIDLNTWRFVEIVRNEKTMGCQVHLFNVPAVLKTRVNSKLNTALEIYIPSENCSLEKKVITKYE